MRPWRPKEQTACVLICHRWDCSYHIVFIPKGRKKILYGKIRKFLGPVFRELARQKDSEIVEGHMVQDHVHMLVKIPPKHSVAHVAGYIKGKSAIAVARQFGGRQRNFNGESLWARGYAVSTVGHDEEKIRQYVRDQEATRRPRRRRAGRFLKQHNGRLRRQVALVPAGRRL